MGLGRSHGRRRQQRQSAAGKEGATAMGFYNVQQGDVPYFKKLADTYSMSDNFHQSVEGGTGALCSVPATRSGSAMAMAIPYSRRTIRWLPPGARTPGSSTRSKI